MKLNIDLPYGPVRYRLLINKNIHPQKDIATLLIISAN